jgi:hypothetical protein
VPLLLSPNVLIGPADLMQPAIEVLMKIMEESLPPQQKASLFRSVYFHILLVKFYKSPYGIIIIVLFPENFP